MNPGTDRLPLRRLASIARRLLVPLALMLAVVACGGAEDAPTPSADSADVAADAGTENAAGASEAAEGSGGDVITELYEAAQEEGELALYSNVTATEEIEALVDRFEEAHPGVTVNLTNRTGAGIMETFLSEKRAGDNTADVIQSVGTAPFQNEYMEEGFIQEYTPTSADMYPDDAIVEGYAYPWQSYTVGAAYNPDLITEEELELLQSYEGWTDPIWQGRISSGSPGSGTLQRALYHWVMEDQDLGEDWLRDFAENEPVAFNSVTPAAERVIAGEYVASFPSLHVVAARAAPDGAPIAWATQEYSISVPSLTALVADAPHPNAGKLWIEWNLSAEGQEAMMEIITTQSLRSDMGDVGFANEDWFENPEEVVVVDDQMFQENVEEVLGLWNDLIGPGRD